MRMSPVSCILNRVLRLAPLAILATCTLVAVPATPQAAEIPGKPVAPRLPEAARPKQLTQLGVDAWHAAGYRGQGVKVAVLDSGFRGYRDHLGKALPANVTARS